MSALLHRLCSAAVVFVWSCCLLPAHDIITTKLTYAREVSRILNQRCMECHQSGSTIPLTTYEQVRPWAVAVKEQVLARAMPPWGAVKGFGDLAPDRGLSQEEMFIIAAWVIGGAPQGDPALAPKPAVAGATVAMSSLHDALTVPTKIKLSRPLDVSAIKPMPTEMVSSARITARLPDGSTQPLLWLYQYNPAWKTAFRFRQPMHLPAGTEVESDTALSFVLESSGTSQNSFR
jgi:hypothetical protein